MKYKIFCAVLASLCFYVSGFLFARIVYWNDIYPPQIAATSTFDINNPATWGTQDPICGTGWAGSGDHRECLEPSRYVPRQSTSTPTLSEFTSCITYQDGYEIINNNVCTVTPNPAPQPTSTPQVKTKCYSYEGQSACIPVYEMPCNQIFPDGVVEQNTPDADGKCWAIQGQTVYPAAPQLQTWICSIADVNSEMGSISAGHLKYASGSVPVFESVTKPYPDCTLQ